ncbi:kinase-like domain-containing protein [Choanephora cucurbitarum]|nr:kinase-like domain-containing protein [Choanephora cucurbitarum]
MSQLKRSHARKSTLLSSIDDFELRCSLGKGSMGKVKLGVHNVTGQKSCLTSTHVYRIDIKGRPLTKEQQMKAKSKEETRELRTIREAHIMMLLRHPNIVQLKNLVAVGPFFYIIMDYVNGGQLLHYIVKQHKLSEAHARHFTRQIISALDYLHRNSIVHRDLKIENILIDKEGQNIKIIDFGLSNLFCPEKRLTTYCGSLYFAAPELLHATPYRGPEIDVWSLGVVIYVMVTGSVPFDDKCMPGLHEKIKRGQVAYPAHLSPACRDLLSHIFVTNPSKRIILADIIRHHWVNEGYTRPIKNHLPPRAPITAPLSPIVLQHMTRGFNMGSIEDIQIKMEMIVSSAVYRSAADYVVQIQQSAALTTKELMKQPYDDPQTIPAAYHPLLSIYHLTQERLLDQENGTDNPLQNDLHLSTAVFAKVLCTR